MNTAVHNKLVSFIWSIADDCLRDVYVRGKYRDVILPMLVLRRIDALLEPTKDKVKAEILFQRQELNLTEFDVLGLYDATGYQFYNTSEWTLQRLQSTIANSKQILEANFTDYLNGFSANVREIIDKFKLKAQIKHMIEKDVLLSVLEKFTSKHINLTPDEQIDSEGKKLPPLSNLGMGYVFEELIRKFNEENNEEAGEHFTPREVIDLITHLTFLPVKDKLPKTITIYDPACGSGGMLTEAQNFIKDEEGEIRALDSDIYLYGKEINDETYAICKADMMIKEEQKDKISKSENIRLGSTLSTDEFADKTFDFMLSNPPYGKSWANEMRYIKDGKDVIDSRFKVRLKGFWGVEQEEDATPRSSDGQLLFLMEMVSKMKRLDHNPAGSRIASVHNGSSLFTGDAGGGESNIRRFLIENDYLEAIIQLPNNLFYNTGITTYIWLLANHKAPHRKGKVQLIDAGQLYRKLRKNLGNKNCEFAPEHIQEILLAYQRFENVKQGTSGLACQVFDNQDFGYHKVTIERPKRLKAQCTPERLACLRYDKSLAEVMEWAYLQWGEQVYTDIKTHEKEISAWAEKNELELNAKQLKTLLSPETWQKQLKLYQTGEALMHAVGKDEYADFNLFKQKAEKAWKDQKIKLTASEKNAILQAVSWYDATAEKVIDRTWQFDNEQLQALTTRLACQTADLPDYGYFPTGKKGEYLAYETESDLRDFENIPLKEDIHAYFLREVKPYQPEAWIHLEATKIGYEISFNKYFYQHKPLRSLDEVTQEILALEQESDGLLNEILFGGMKNEK